jgi:transcriptional regulator with XRE-family HTH domain
VTVEYRRRRGWGTNIKAARKARRWSQKRLAEACGVEQSSVSRWERGAAVPSEGHKIVIARSLEVEARRLFPLDDRVA